MIRFFRRWRLRMNGNVTSTGERERARAIVERQREIANALYEGISPREIENNFTLRWELMLKGKSE